MIAPLRRRHLLMTSALLVAVPAVLVLSLRVRPSAPLVRQLPGELSADLPGQLGQDPAQTRLGHLFAGHDISVVASTGGGGGVLTLRSPGPLVHPDVLLYWTPTEVSDRLPDTAILLGAYAGRARSFPLPEQVAGNEGFLVLYALAHQVVISSGPLPRLLTPAPPAHEVGSEEGAPS